MVKSKKMHSLFVVAVQHSDAYPCLVSVGVTCTTLQHENGEDQRAAEAVVAATMLCYHDARTAEPVSFSRDDKSYDWLLDRFEARPHVTMDISGAEAEIRYD